MDFTTEQFRFYAYTMHKTWVSFNGMFQELISAQDEDKTPSQRTV